MQYIYTMKGLGKVHPPDTVVLKDIWLSFLPGAKIGVLGLNGAGKSSLLRIMAGEDNEFIGEAFPADGITVGFLPQEPRLDPSKTVKGNVEEGVSEIKALLDRYDELNMKLGEELSPEQMDKVLEEQGRLQDRIDQTNAWEIDSQLEVAMDALRCPPPDAKIDVLSGGEKRRVALCRLLIQEPDILLLDEPTNHLDAESVEWLEQFLQRFPGTVVAVTHDRYFLDNAAGWILELVGAAGVEHRLQLGLLLGQLVEVGVGLGIRRVHLLEPFLRRRGVAHRLLDGFPDGFVFAETRFLFQVADPDAGHADDFALVGVVHARHDSQERGLA